jgi:glycosyltransferase involved in cell wall biosynthesis
MLTIFPNYAVCYKENKHWVESSQSLVNEEIINSGIGLRIAAVVDYSFCEGNYTVLDTENINFKSLGRYDSRHSSFLKTVNYFKYIINIVKIIKSSKFSYIYSPGHIGLFAILIAVIFNKPYAIYLRGEWIDSTPKFFHFFFRTIFKKAKFIICTGMELTKNISKINKNTISVSPMSALLNLDTFFNTKKDYSNINILFVGQLIKKKGVYELIYAFHKINSTPGLKINLKLDIIGNGIERNNLIDLIKKLNLEKKISIFSINSDNTALAYQYFKSDIFCLPTFSEGFPRVIYEAMHFSIPIVTTKVGQIPSLIKDEENGIFCITGSSDSLAEKLYDLITNKPKRLMLGRNGNLTLQPFLKIWRKTSHGKQIVDMLSQYNV